MAVDAGTIRGTVEAEDNASKVLNQVAQESENLGSQLTSMGSMAAGVEGGFLELGKAALGALEDIAAMVLESAKAAEVIHNLGLTTGIGAEAVQQFQAAAREAGVGSGAFETAILRLERAIGANSKALAKWGFDARELAAVPAADAFQMVIDKIDSLGDHTAKVAAITDLFGRGAVKSLLPMMDALEELSNRLRATLSDDQVSALRDVDGAVDALETSWTDLLNQYSAAIAANPALVDGIDAVRDAVTLLGVGMKSLDWEAFWDAAGIVMSTFAARVKANFDQLVTTLHTLVGAAKELQHFFADDPKIDTDAFTPDTGALNDDMDARVKLLNEGLKESIAATKKWAQEIRDAEKAAKEWDKSLSAAEANLTKLSGAAEKNDLKDEADDLKALDALSKELTASSRAVELQILKVADAYKKWAEEQSKLELDESARLMAEEARALKAAAAASIQMSADIANLGDAVNYLGDTLGIDLLSSLGEAVAGFGSFNAAMKEAETDMQKAAVAVDALSSAYAGASTSTGKSALSGAAKGAGAGAAFGPWGAVIGGVIGGIAGILGSSKKKAEELKKKQDEAMAAFGDMFDDWKNARKELAAVGVEGINALVGSLVDDEGNITEAFTSVANASEYVGATFAMLRASGMSTADALQAIGPALDALTMADPEAIAGTGGAELVQLAAFAAANEQLLNFTMGIGLTAQALAGFGMFSQDLAMRMSIDMNNAIAQMVAGGLTEAQASALVAQDLYNLKMAAEQSGVVLDEHTQQLIRDAEAAGLFENLEDPMKRLVEINGAMVAAMGEMVKLLGGAVPAAVQKMIDEFNSAKINVNVNVDVPGGGDPQTDRPEFQHGSGGIQDFGSGTLATLHGREGVFTESQIQSIASSDNGQLSGLIMNLPSMMTRAMKEAVATGVSAT